MKKNNLNGKKSVLEKLFPNDKAANSYFDALKDNSSIKRTKYYLFLQHSFL